eukprot:COSAG06_NODE_42708_length_379_cov_0.817857_1_plen_24_part_01
MVALDLQRMQTYFVHALIRKRDNT